MKRIQSLSKKRLIIEAKVNGKNANFLIDTGASVGIMDSKQQKHYNFEVGREFGSVVVGAGGEIDNVHYCGTFAELEGKYIPQFLVANINDVVKSIKKETGIEILGIISLPQMKMCGLGIDANDMEIIVE